MKVLLTHPFCRPYMRRGSETILAQLTDYWVSHGHQVTVLSSKPGPRESFTRNATYVLASQESFLVRFLGLSRRLYFFLPTLRFLLTHRNFDVVHCLHHIDACAARLAGKITGIPYVQSFFGIPSARHYRRRPVDHLAIQYAVRGAAEVMVLSRSARDLLQAGYHTCGTCITGFVDPAEFPLVAGRDLERPLLLAVAAFMERRKGLDVLIRCFAMVRESVPTARLCVVGHVTAERQATVLARIPKELHDSIEFFGAATTEQLPGLYQKAALLVLPSIWEALGTVLLEALSSGTPVVATRHSGSPDVVSDQVGSLFEPGDTRREATNAEGLARAILRTLELYRHPQLAYHCHQHALRFTWKNRGPQVQAVYERAIARSRSAGPSPVQE